MSAKAKPSAIKTAPPAVVTGRNFLGSIYIVMGEVDR